MLNKYMNNYKILFSLRILKSVLNNFIDIFLVLYFLTVSGANILPLGIYKLVAMVTVYLVMFLLRNKCKMKNRIIFLRIGIILYFIYFLAIILLKEKVTDYIYIIGIIYGLEEGFYYSVYNTIESDGIENKDRAKYIGSYTALKNVISVIFPLIFGGLIKKTGFIVATIFALLIVIIEIILSNILQDKNIPKISKTNFKEFDKITSKYKEFKYLMFSKICSGLTYSEGALSYVVTIYIIKIFSESVSLGIFTSVFSIISIIIGLLFVKIIKPKYYNFLSGFFSSLNVLFLCIMLINCNFITIVLYNLFGTISKGLSDLIMEKNTFNLSNMKFIKQEYKVEYFLFIETYLFIGRVISNALFISLAFYNYNLMLVIFVLFVVMQMISVIVLNKSVNKNIEMNT